MRIQPMAVAFQSKNKNLTYIDPASDTSSDTETRPNTMLRAAVLCALAAAAAPALALAAVSAQASDTVSEQASDTKSFNIDAQPLDTALKAFAFQSNREIFFAPELTRGKQTQGVNGKYEDLQALKTLLEETGLTYTVTGSKAILVRGQTSGSPIAGIGSTKTSYSRGTTGNLRLSQSENTGSNNQDDNKDSTESTKLEEIVVTATKRAEKLQETPLSITAISNAEIGRKDLTGTEDYLAFVPGVSSFSLSGQTNLVFRGISANPATEAGEKSSGTSVGTYFGEVSMAGMSYAGGTTNMRLVDMERIEVLRGPQGTLYGAGSLSGTVKNIPVEPNLSEFSGQVASGGGYTAGNGGFNYKVEGVINFPIVNDALAVRAVGYRHSESGYVDNVAASTPAFVNNAALMGVDPSQVRDEAGVGELTYTGGRVSVLWRPTDNLNVSLNLATQESEEDGSGQAFTGGDFTQTRFRFSGIDGILRDNEGGENGLDIGNLVVQYDFALGSLLSSSSWVSTDGERVLDLMPIFGFPWVQDYDQEADSFSQEVRFVSEFGGPLQILTGLYYEDVDRSILSNAYELPGTNLFPTLGNNPQLFASFPQTWTLQQKAAFGELSYDLTSRLQFTVGARYFEYERSSHEIWVGAFGPRDEALEADESGTNYKANVSFKASESAFLYAQWAEGFRFGNTQTPAPATICDTDNDGVLDGTSVPINGQYDSDFLENFEIGGKFGLFDGKMQLNVSAYHMNWDGIPVSVQSPVVTCSVSQIDNAGKAISRGAELEAVFRITPAVQLNLSGSYIDAKLDEDAPTLKAKAGERLPGSPKHNLSAGLEYDFELAGRPAYVRGDFAYVGGFYSVLLQTPRLPTTPPELGDYKMVNLAAGIDLGGLSIQIVGQNLTNDDAQTWGGLTYDAYYLRPRTIGMNVGYRF